MESVNTLQLNDITIICRSSDGFINATELCRAGKRRFKDWSQLKSTKKLLEGYEEYNKDLSQLSWPAHCNLIKFEDNGTTEKYTWVHPEIAIDIAQWISVKFRIQVLKWTRELLEKGIVEAQEESKQYHEQLLQVDHIVKSDVKRSRQKLTDEEVKQTCYDLRVLKLKPK